MTRTAVFKGVQSTAPLWVLMCFECEQDSCPQWWGWGGRRADADEHWKAELDQCGTCLEEFSFVRDAPCVPGAFVWEGDADRTETVGDEGSWEPTYSGSWRRAKDSEVLAWLAWCQRAVDNDT